MKFKTMTETKRLLFLSGAVIVTANLAGTGLLLIERQNRVAVESLERREPGQGDYEETLSARVSGKKEQDITVKITEKYYDSEEAQKLLKEAEEGLAKLAVGKNESFEKVETSLYLPEYYPGTPIRLAFWTDKPRVLDSQGQLGQEIEENPEQVLLSCELSLCGESRYWESTVCVYAPILTAGQQIEGQVQKNLKGDENVSKVKLPKQIEEKEVVFYRETAGNGKAVCALGTLAGILVFPLSREQKKKKTEKRREALLRDYPNLLTGILLFLRAGMTVRTACFRITAEYDLYGEKRKKEDRPGYQEMKCICRLMENGMAEDKAYEQLGSRCGLPEYKVLSVLLVQNLKKGGAGILGALEKEAAGAVGEQKRKARARGEQAAAKLLLPMMLQLIVVLIIVMFPAFQSLV